MVLIMVASQFKPSELYILSWEKTSAFGLDPFHSQECRSPRALFYAVLTCAEGAMMIVQLIRVIAGFTVTCIGAHSVHTL